MQKRKFGCREGYHRRPSQPTPGLFLVRLLATIANDHPQPNAKKGQELDRDRIDTVPPAT